MTDMRKSQLKIPLEFATQKAIDFLPLGAEINVAKKFHKWRDNLVKMAM